MGQLLWSEVPVSYTHLDVYKRQVQECGHVTLADGKNNNKQ